MGEREEDDRHPGVMRRRHKSGLFECLCSKCGKWSTFGTILGGPDEFYYLCPECDHG
jgi:hypothetical protein